MAEEKKYDIPQWLKNLQENSWELEILISGGAIFSLFHLSDLLIESVQQFNIGMLLPGNNILFMMVMFCTKILTLGFMLHLALRGFWLALVCINYVYPDGIKQKEKKFKSPFKSRYTANDDLREQIMKIDHMCGKVIYLTIITSIAVTGIAILFSLILFIGIEIGDLINLAIFNIAIGISFIFFLLYILDLTFFGFLRKTPILTYLVFPFFYVYDLFSLRFIYRKSLLLFSSNVVKWRQIFAGLFFSLFAFTLTYFSVKNYMHWGNIFDDRLYKTDWIPFTDNSKVYTDLYYMTEWKDKSYQVGISEKFVSSKYLEVFVRYQRKDDFIIDPDADSEKYQNYSPIVQVDIDDSLYTNLDWYKKVTFDHQLGISAIMPIGHLSEGNHNIRIYKNSEGMNPRTKQELGVLDINIPFWIESKNSLPTKLEGNND
ncbi:MAG: hypothetical protein WDZ35_15210 [Crocinitomicaceae bacterium]